MIDVQPYIDELERMRRWLMDWIEIKCWMVNPLKPTPWDSFQRITF